MHIYVMRHGQSMANVHKIVSGSRESPLSELGITQAKLAAKDIQALHIDHIVSSPMGRARQTAEIIADTLHYPHDQIEIIKDLHERHLGSLEGKSYATDKTASGDFAVTEDTPGMEPINMLHSRVQHALRQVLEQKHANVLVVCHNNIGRMLQIIALNKPAMAMYDIPRMENATVLRLL